ncbi:pimelyl-ACP methyl ester esterase BioV [Sulfurovum sp. bin170]|uniref:pimelyl-ACP methyl ester esterase BioV n=1 Tax=Sulfurovum sp. bin170 TaxID=2695268 RepID=UPI0013DE86CC|nr:pimelyl-ACP methyl ester esterase BioV [Sulfurovum sp. bin170]NEW61547.1 pimelyl-ACP methyl ester esterase BioV [Sulfurovum sp. bin170]
MNYFSGFALKGEEKFFREYTIDSDLCMVGFSYGAQKAFEYVYSSPKRIDRLILLSPAFFQNHRKSFIRTQLRYFKADQESYIKQFLENVSYPSNINLYEYLDIGKYEELESLLSYVWDREKILELIDRGVTIEVFIGGEDRIVDSEKSFEFFSEITTTYLLKDFGHLLRV